MNNIFQFGEQFDAYDVPVLNERAVRASAGILFFLVHEEKWKLHNNCK